MSRGYLTAEEVSRCVIEHYQSPQGRATIDGVSSARRSELLAEAFKMKVYRVREPERKPDVKHYLARIGIDRDTIDALEYGNMMDNVAQKMFQWKRRDGIRGRAHGLLLCGQRKGKTVAACMAIDPRFVPNPDHHTKLCVAESTVIRLLARQDNPRELPRYKAAHTLVIDSFGQSGMASRNNRADLMELLRIRWANHRSTILTSRHNPEKLAQTYAENWCTVLKYCHIVDVDL